MLSFLLSCNSQRKRKEKKQKNKGPCDVKAPGCCQTQRTKSDILYTQLNNTQLMHYSLLQTQEACKYFIKGKLVRLECNTERRCLKRRETDIKYYVLLNMDFDPVRVFPISVKCTFQSELFLFSYHEYQATIVILKCGYHLSFFPCKSPQKQVV